MLDACTYNLFYLITNDSKVKRKFAREIATCRSTETSFAVLNHDQTDHNANSMGHWCMTIVARSYTVILRNHFAGEYLTFSCTCTDSFLSKKKKKKEKNYKGSRFPRNFKLYNLLRVCKIQSMGHCSILDGEDNTYTAKLLFHRSLRSTVTT